MSTNTGSPFNFTLPQDTDLADFVNVFLKPQLTALNTYALHSTATQVLVNKSIADATDNSKTLGFNLAGTAAGLSTTLVASATGTSKTITLPNLTDTLVGRTTTDTLTNKTLTSPSITSPSITSPSITSPTISSGGLIVSAGNVGIGTTSPRNVLELSASTVATSSSTTLRIGGVVGTYTPGNYTAIGQEINRHRLIFSSWRDVQTDTIGAKIEAINYTNYNVASSYHLNQRTDIVFSTLNTLASATDSTIEKMRITAAGNVGIGTASPTSSLTVNGNMDLVQTYATYLVNSYYDTSWKYIGNGMAWGIGNNFGGITNGVTIATAGVNASGAGAALTWTPTFNIGTNGNVGIGTTSPIAMLHVAGTSQFVASSGPTYVLLDSLASEAVNIVFKNLTNNRWWISSSDDTRLYVLDANANDGVYIAQNATSWTSNSDSRLKDVKETITNALDKVNALSGVRYTWKRDADKPDAKTRVGLIAQDVLAVLPEAVDDDTPELVTDEVTGKISGGLGVRYTELIPLLVNAIKELAQRVEALEVHG